jgi:DNA repair exonuclease SbcCD ATPase subunit
MKKLVFLSVIAVVAMVMASCGNKAEELQKQVDSLQTALTERTGDYDRLNEFLAVVNEGLDSISVQENGLLVRNPESPLPSRAEMKKGLSELKNTLQTQRERIAKLEKDLAAGRGDISKLRGIINVLKEQIEAKDAQISDLLAQLEQSNISIEQLTTRVGNLTQQNVQQEVKIAEQEEVMAVQDQMLNEGFIKIASKKELKDAGLLSGGGLFSKKKVDMSKVDQKLFQKVDIRNVKEIPIPSKKPVILSPNPAGSYRLEQGDNSSTLIITDPGKFWSVSNFLIIQTK